MNSIFTKLERFSERQPVLLGSLPFILFVFSFFLTYGYYLFDLNVPGFSHDTIQYFNAAFKIIDGEIPMQNLPVDIPIGYPLFISLFISLKLDIITIIYAQIAILFFSSLLIINELVKINKYSAIVFALMMSYWIFDPILFNYNTCFYPDSLYASALVLCTSFTMRYIRKKDLTSLILLSLSIILASSVRSNGLIVFIIPLVLITRNLYLKDFYRVKSIIGATLLSILILSSANLFFKNYFFPGDLHRIQKVSKRIVKSNRNSDASNDVVKVDSRGTMFYKYLFNTKNDRASFYYTHLRFNHLKYTNNNTALNNSFTKNEQFIHFNSNENQNLEISKIANRIYNNHKIRDYESKKIEQKTDVQNKPRRLVLWGTYYIQLTIYRLFFKFPIVVIIFILLSLWGLFMILKRNNPYKKEWQNIAWIPFVYWLSTLTIVFTHCRIQERYIVVSEFIIYLTIALFIGQIVSNIENKKALI